jgi:hypothetical protein
MKKRVPNANGVDREEKGLARFENLRFLGNGAAGRVDLIRNKKTNE